VVLALVVTVCVAGIAEIEKSLIPVPVRGIVRVAGVESLVTPTLPVLAPTAEGRNTTSMLHVSSVASGEVHVLVCEKSPAALTPRIFIEDLLELIKVTV